MSTSTQTINADLLRTVAKFIEVSYCSSFHLKASPCLFLWGQNWSLQSLRAVGYVIHCLIVNVRAGRWNDNSVASFLQPMCPKIVSDHPLQCLSWFNFSRTTGRKLWRSWSWPWREARRWWRHRLQEECPTTGKRPLGPTSLRLTCTSRRSYQVWFYLF